MAEQGNIKSVQMRVTLESGTEGDAPKLIKFRSRKEGLYKKLKRKIVENYPSVAELTSHEWVIHYEDFQLANDSDVEIELEAADGAEVPVSVKFLGPKETFQKPIETFETPGAAAPPAAAAAAQNTSENSENSKRLKCTVYAGNLALNVTENDLRSFFADCGEIRYVRIFNPKSNARRFGRGRGRGRGGRGRGRGRGRGGGWGSGGTPPTSKHALVEFAQEYGAIMAKTKDQKDFFGKNIKLSDANFAIDVAKMTMKPSPPIRSKADDLKLRRTAFVSALPIHINTSAVKALFGTCGEIEDVQISVKQKPFPRANALIQFTEESGVKNAMGMVGTVVGTQKISVFPSKETIERYNPINISVAPDSASVSVSEADEGQSQHSAYSMPAKLQGLGGLQGVTNRGTDSAEERKKRSVFVRNLPPNTNKGHLIQLFKKCGFIEDSRIFKKPLQPNPSCSALIQFRTIASVLNAKRLARRNIQGHVISVFNASYAIDEKKDLGTTDMETSSLQSAPAYRRDARRDDIRDSRYGQRRPPRGGHGKSQSVRLTGAQDVRSNSSSMTDENSQRLRRTVFARNLPPNVKGKDITGIFAKSCGYIDQFHIQRTRTPYPSANVLIQFKHVGSAQKAVRAFAQTNIMGRTVSVTMSNRLVPPRDTPNKGSSPHTSEPRFPRRDKTPSKDSSRKLLPKYELIKGDKLPRSVKLMCAEQNSIKGCRFGQRCRYTHGKRYFRSIENVKNIGALVEKAKLVLPLSDLPCMFVLHTYPKPRHTTVTLEFANQKAVEALKSYDIFAGTNAKPRDIWRDMQGLCPKCNSLKGCSEEKCDLFHMIPPIMLTIEDNRKDWNDMSSFLSKAELQKTLQDMVGQGKFVIHTYEDKKLITVFTIEFRHKTDRSKVEAWVKEKFGTNKICSYLSPEAVVSKLYKREELKMDDFHNNLQSQVLSIAAQVAKSQYTYEWKWKDDNAQWMCYPQKVSQEIQQARVGAQIKFKTKLWEYVITKDTEDTARQRNTSTDKVRALQRFRSDRDDGMRYPQWWQRQPHSSESDKPYDWVKVSPTALTLAQRAKENLFQTVTKQFQIRSVATVQNELQWTSHQSLEENWLNCDRLSADQMNVKWLWHGTDLDTIRKISARGFLRDFSSRAAYGRGVYFARDALYSIDTTYAKPDDSGRQYLFYCRVICGEMTQGKSKYDKRPPLKGSGAHAHEYETMVDNVRNPSIFVVNTDHQAYPVLLFVLKKNSVLGRLPWLT